MTDELRVMPHTENAVDDLFAEMASRCIAALHADPSPWGGEVSALRNMLEYGAAGDEDARRLLVKILRPAVAFKSRIRPGDHGGILRPGAVCVEGPLFTQCVECRAKSAADGRVRKERMLRKRRGER